MITFLENMEVFCRGPGKVMLANAQLPTTFETQVEREIGTKRDLGVVREALLRFGSRSDIPVKSSAKPLYGMNHLTAGTEANAEQHDREPGQPEPHAVLHFTTQKKGPKCNYCNEPLGDIRDPEHLKLFGTKACLGCAQWFRDRECPHGDKCTLKSKCWYRHS